MFCILCTFCYDYILLCLDYLSVFVFNLVVSRLQNVESKYFLVLVYHCTNCVASHYWMLSYNI